MENIIINGHIFVTIKNSRTNRIKKFDFPNTILDAGKEAIIETLIEGKPFTVTSMLFGDGGFVDNVRQTIIPSQTELFGIVRANKKIVKQIDPEIPKQAVISAVLEYEDANGHILNEMGLLMDNGKLFSMSIFPNNLTKTDEMEIGWGWLIAMV